MDPITDYDSLQAAMAGYLSRSDLTTQIPVFIQMAETKFATTIKARGRVVRATATISHEYESLPTDYIEMINLSLLTSPPADLTFLSASNWIETTMPQQVGGNNQPIFFTIIGNQARFAPIPGGNYTAEMQYYANLVPLSDDAPSNWLMEKAPDVYLYGSLMEAAAYLRNDPRLQIWATGLDAATKRVNEDNAHGIYNAAPLTARPG